MRRYMKKILIIIVIIVLITVFLSGCGEDENKRGGLVGEDSDFYGIWSAGAGSFTMGDSIRFLEDGTCDFFWSNGNNILFTGTWDRTINSTSGAYIIVITISEKVTIYCYDFYDNYKTLRLREENSTEYVYYYKQ